MKSTKLLAALAGTALLAACTQEELFKVDNTPQQMEEVVGAKLVGTDVSLSANNGGVLTRLNPNGGVWEKTDVLGLGWIVNGNPFDEQSTDKHPNSDKLYANHKFSYSEDTKKFATEGNIYEGWYFSYYPWTYEKQIKDNKVFAVNPEQKSKVLKERYSQSLHLSNRQFIDETKLVDNTLTSPFELVNVTSAIRVRTTALDAFAAGQPLCSLAVESISIKVGKDIFADSLKLVAQNIPAWNDELETSADNSNKKELLNNAYKGEKRFLIPVNGEGQEDLESEITTVVAEAEYTVADNTEMVALVVPTKADLNELDMEIVVKVASGEFKINYNTASNKNKIALITLKEAYKEGGKLNNANSLINLDIELYDDIFFTDFNHITNIGEWEDAVKMVNILGRSEETFCIDSTIVFTDTIPMPETCKLTVNRATTGSGNRKLESFVLQDGEFYGWPETLTSNVYLTIAEDATLYDAHEFNNVRAIVNNGKMVVPSRETKEEGLTIGASRDYTLTNNGTIVLGKYAKAQRVDNTDGRIEVIYGSYIELRNEAEAGEIAYVVMPEDAETPSRIKDVVATTGNDFGHASVNILVFDKENVTEFNFTKPINGKENDNPYNDNSSSADEDVLKLDGVSLEINGVAVTSSSTEEIVTVKNVTMTGAEASLTNVNVAGNLTVTDGGDVEVTTIAGDVKTDGDVTADAIAGGLTLSGNGVVSVKSIGGDVNVAGGEINATVAIAGNVTAADATIVARTIEGDVTVNGDNTSIEGNKIKGKVDVTADGEVTLNVKTIEKALTNDGVVVIEGEEDVVIPTINNNATLTANTTINVHNITLKKGVANTTVQEDPEEIIWYTGTYIQGGTTTGKILPKPVTPETGTTVTVASPAELATAAIEDGATIALAAGEYVIPSAAKGKNVTFVGTGNPEDVKVAVTKVGTGGENCDYGLDGSTVTFEGITITTNSSTYIGYARCNGTYKNCIINGTYTLYGNSTFEDCTFNVSGDVYNIWTWGAPTAKFVDCTFNSDGKAMLLYGTANTKLTIENCVFNDKGGLTDLKAAVEIGNDYGKSYELIVNNTAVNGYEINDKGINTGTTLWANKNSMSKENLNVVVDGVDVY